MSVIHDIAHTALQSLLSLTFLFILARLMGKKQVSQLTFFDYVVGISIGSIAADFAVDPSVSDAVGITALIVYAMLPIFFSYLGLRSYTVRKIVDGKPTVLIEHGKILQSNLRKVKLNVNDLLEECRGKNAFNIADVEYAILETNGKLSVQIKAEHQPLTPKDMNIPVPYKGLCLNVIIDGTVLEDKLPLLGKDRAWLEEELKKQGFTDLKGIILAYVDTAGQLCVQLKDWGKHPNPFM